MGLAWLPYWLVRQRIEAGSWCGSAGGPSGLSLRLQCALAADAASAVEGAAGRRCAGDRAAEDSKPVGHAGLRRCITPSRASLSTGTESALWLRPDGAIRIAFARSRQSPLLLRNGERQCDFLALKKKGRARKRPGQK